MKKIICSISLLLFVCIVMAQTQAEIDKMMKDAGGHEIFVCQKELK